MASTDPTPARSAAAGDAASAAEFALAALFHDASPAEARRLLARLERAGAALYERLAAAEPDPRTREALLAAARREIANAEVLEALGAAGAGSETSGAVG